LPRAISRAACSLRQACQGPAKKRPRCASSSSTEVPNRLEEPAIVGDEDDRGVEVDQVALEPLERGDVEMVRRSSRSSRSGRVASARASEARVSSPPEKVESGRSACSASKPSPRSTASTSSRQR
jgi:hypothetical protein